MRAIFGGGFITAVAVCGLATRVAMVRAAYNRNAATKATADASSEKSPPGGLGPSPELQSLAKAIGGRWSTSIRYGPSSMPESPVYQGDQVWRIGPGGFTLIEEEHYKSATDERFLLAIQWWDSGSHKLKGILCNNSGPGACDVNSYYNSSLTWDGKQYVIDLDFAQGDKKMRWHEVFNEFTANSFTQTGDIGQLGGVLKRAVTIHATRVAEPK